MSSLILSSASHPQFPQSTAGYRENCVMSSNGLINIVVMKLKIDTTRVTRNIRQTLKVVLTSLSLLSFYFLRRDQSNYILHQMSSELCCDAPNEGHFSIDVTLLTHPLSTTTRCIRHICIRQGVTLIVWKCTGCRNLRRSATFERRNSTQRKC